MKGRNNAENEALFRHSVEDFIQGFPARTQDILRSRFDLSGDGKGLTLEAIGQKYDITRERIRQIIRQALSEIGEKRSKEIQAMKDRIVFAVRERGGIIEKSRLLEKLSGDGRSEHGAIHFIFEYAQDDVQSVKRHPKLRDVVMARDFVFSRFEEVVEKTKRVLEEVQTPIHFDELHRKVRALDSALEKEDFESFIAASSEVGKNPFERWGLVKWSEIVPRGTREKARVILKYAEEPLHFRDIASRIDRHGLGKKRPTNPQTVHNELIKDESFVLVGRGTYALKEWGYSSGTVRDMITDVLKKEKGPLSKERIFEEVLKMKKVKRTTILINLSSYFAHCGKGTYAIKEQ